MIGENMFMEGDALKCPCCKEQLRINYNLTIDSDDLEIDESEVWFDISGIEKSRNPKLFQKGRS